LPRAKVTSAKATVAAIGKIREVMSESLRCVFHGNIQKTLDYERTFILAIELSNTLGADCLQKSAKNLPRSFSTFVASSILKILRKRQTVNRRVHQI
jgi:hypothetical protein